MIELDALSARLTVADAALVSAPPTRKNTSETRSGSPGAPPWPDAPTVISAGEFTGPASMISPDTFTPLPESTTSAWLPAVGTRVAKPSPSTIVPGRVTSIAWLRS